jgi:hypothetical protein
MKNERNIEEHREIVLANVSCAGDDRTNDERCCHIVYTHIAGVIVYFFSADGGFIAVRFLLSIYLFRNAAAAS